MQEIPRPEPLDIHVPMVDDMALLTEGELTGPHASSIKYVHEHSRKRKVHGDDDEPTACNSTGFMNRDDIKRRKLQAPLTSVRAAYKETKKGRYVTYTRGKDRAKIAFHIQAIRTQYM